MCADLLKRVRASESVGVCVQIHTANGKNNTTQQMIQQHPEQLFSAGVLGKLVGRGGVCATPGVLLTTWVWLRSALVWRGVHWCGVECTVVV